MYCVIVFNMCYWGSCIDHIYFTPRYYKECINVLILYTVPGYSACVGNDAAKIGGRREVGARGKGNVNKYFNSLEIFIQFISIALAMLF